MTAPVASRPFDVTSARSLLFVPGSRPDRFYKASVTEADGIILDLEDAVAEKDKNSARENVHEWLAAGGRGVVRINGADTPWHSEDVQMAAEHGCPVMLPKAETLSELVALRSSLRDGTEIIPLIETALGILRSYSVCLAPGVVRVAFGNVDFAAQLGIDNEDATALLTARTQIVLASAAAGIAGPFDGVTTDLVNIDRTSRDAKHAASLGFTGKLCVHPRQIAAVHPSFTPAEHELDRARDILETSKDGNAVALDGEMIDRPVIEQARRLLARGAATVRTNASASGDA